MRSGWTERPLTGKANMPSKKRPLLFGVIALATVLLSSICCLMLWKQSKRGMPEDAGVSASIESPDGVYKAVIFYQNGGGAGASYCFDSVTVVPTDLPDAQAWNTREVFSASCTDDLLHRVVWTSTRQLQITFDPSLAVQGIDAVTLRGHAGKNAEVEIRFEMQ